MTDEISINEPTIQEQPQETQVTEDVKEEKESTSTEEATLIVEKSTTDQLLDLIDGYKSALAEGKLENTRLKGEKVTKQLPQGRESLDEVFNMVNKLAKTQMLDFELSEDNTLNKHIREHVKDMNATETRDYISSAKKFYSKMKDDVMASSGIQSPKTKYSKDELDKIALCETLYPNLSPKTGSKW